MTVTQIIIGLIAATFGSLGYAMVYGLKKRYLTTAAIGGFLCWGLYLLGMQLWDNILLASISASAFAAIYGEITARIKKAPATLFFVTAIIPLIPGRTLYYTCSNAVVRNWDAAKQYANITLQYAVAIAVGACIVWAITLTVENIKKAKNTK